MTLIPEDSYFFHSPFVVMAVYRKQVMNGVLVNSQHRVSSVGKKTNPVVILSVLQGIF